MEELIIVIFVIWLIWLTSKIYNLNDKIENLNILNKENQNIQKINSSKKSLDQEGLNKDISNKDKVSKNEVDDEEVEELISNYQQAQNFQTEPQYNVKEKISDFSLEDFFSRKFFPIVSIVSIVAAIGFFALWAFEHNIIGPKGRIALGSLLSICLLVAGEILKGKYPKFFPLLSSAGIAGLIIMTFISQNFYGFINSTESFFLYIVQTTAGITLAIRYDSRILGNFSIIGGLLAPILMNSPLIPINILSFLLILSVAGFTLSIWKSWPEIVWILMVGVLGFEIAILNQDLLKDSPIIFLLFIAALHILLGSGGILRKFLEEKKEEGNLSPEEISEVVLFVVSIFAGNFLAAGVFDMQDWEHLGFLLLGEGLIFFFLARGIKSISLVFEKIFLGATLISIIVATPLEIGADNDFTIALAWAAQGIVFVLVGQKFHERIFELFGRIALILSFIASIEILDNANLAETTTLLLALNAGLLISAATTDFETKLWRAVAVILASISLVIWNFGSFERILTQNWEFILFIPIALWSGLLSFSILKTESKYSAYAGFAFQMLLNFSLYFWLYENYNNLLSPFLGTLIMLIGNFATLWVLYYANVGIDKETKKYGTILCLALSTLSIFILGLEIFEDPVTSGLWILWGAALFIFGIKKNWPRFRYFGIGVFVFLIAKIYLVDLWQWEMWVRAIAVMLLGAGLLYVTFSNQKFLLSKEKDDKINDQIY